MGPPDPNESTFSFSGFLSGVTSIASEAAKAVTSIRGSVDTIQGQSTNTRTDAAVQSAGMPWYVWAIGAVIVYKLANK